MMLEMSADSDDTSRGWRGMLRRKGRSRCAGCDGMCIAACWGIGWRGMSCSTECLPCCCESGPCCCESGPCCWESGLCCWESGLCCWESGPCCWESGLADSLAFGSPASSCLSPLQTRVFNDNVLPEQRPKGKPNSIAAYSLGYEHSWAFEKQKTTRDATGCA